MKFRMNLQREIILKFSITISKMQFRFYIKSLIIFILLTISIIIPSQFTGHWLILTVVSAVILVIDLIFTSNKNFEFDPVYSRYAKTIEMLYTQELVEPRRSLPFNI